MVDFEGAYEVSSHGKVRSLDRLTAHRWRQTIKGQLIKPFLDRRGYYARDLSKGGKKHRKYWHHLVYEAFVGPHDGFDVDHINRVKTDNRPENLRVATRAQNLANMRLHARNTSGVKGVFYVKKHGTWQADISNGKRGVTYLGRFKTLEEAAECYRLAAIARYGDFANPARKLEATL